MIGIRVAAYLRVSTDQQTHASQETELREYCARRGWSRVQWFTDTASGAKQSRIGLDDLMALVRRGKVDVLLSYKLDRIARSLSHLAQIIAELQAHGVALVCPSQGIDTSNSNPAAHLQLNILAAVAQFERELTVERVRAGLAAAKQRGVRLGRPPTPRSRVSRAEEMFASGATVQAVSLALDMPRSTAAQIRRESKTVANRPSSSAGLCSLKTAGRETEGADLNG